MVSIIVPNYNGMNYLAECLESVFAQDFEGLFEVILVDNGSTDGSVQYVKETYQNDVAVIQLAENYGFCSAVNIGVKKAKYEFVLLLNNDVVLDKFFLREITKCMNQRTDCFSCASKMIQYHRRDLLDGAGDLMTILGWAVQRGVGERITKYNEVSEVFSTSGGASLFRKSMFTDLGLLDEAFISYLEDVDIGYRAQLQGFINLYCPTAICWHMGSATTGMKYSQYKVKYSARNSVLLLYKNMPTFQLIINLPFILLGHLIRYFYFCKHNLGKLYLESLVEGIRDTNKVKPIRLPLRQWSKYLRIEYKLVVDTWIYLRNYLARKTLYKSSH
jgi:GT2 family glycosyltransferase